jgi:hypothetical protein
MATPASVVPPRAEPEPAPAPKPTPTAQVSPPPTAPRPRADVVPGDGTFLDDHDAFRRDVQRLVRQHAWQELAAITSAAAESARWAALPEMKANLLADLARIYRDRLTDPSSTEDTYRRLTEVDPAHEEAVSFLSERYRERGDWRALYDLRGAAVDATWDPKLRLDWTRESVSIAQDRLRSTDLEIDASGRPRRRPRGRSRWSTGAPAAGSGSPSSW